MKISKILFKQKIKFIFLIFSLFLYTLLLAFFMLYCNFSVNKLLVDTDYSLFPTFIIIASILVFSITLTRYIESYLYNSCANYFYFSLRKEYIDALFEKDISEITKTENSTYISFVLNDLPILSTLFDSIIYIIQSALYFILATAVLIYLGWQVSLITIGMVFIGFLPPVIYGFTNNKNFKRESDLNKEYTEKIKSSLGGIDIIKATNSEKIFLETIDKTNREKLQIRTKITNVFNINNSFHSFTSYLMYCVIILLSIHLVIQGEISLGSISVILFLSSGLSDTIASFYNSLVQFLSTKAIRNRFNSFINLKNHKKEEKNELVFSNISVKNISVKYKKRMILNNISFCFKKGKKYLILGESGCGKTTILNLLSKELKDYTGEINYGITNYNQISDLDLYSQISVVKQEPYVFGLSIKNNIDLLGENNETKLQKCLELCNLNSFINKLPNGINEIINEEVNKISEGEKQRINIARALYRQSNILLLDEITSSLDKTNSYYIEKNILELKNITIISVAHKLNLELLKYYDEILLLESGNIKLNGSYENIKNSVAFTDYLKGIDND